MFCHHRADDHKRGIINLENGKQLRPYSGRCKVDKCFCIAYQKIDGLVLPKGQVKQIFKLKARFQEAKSKDRKKMIYNQIVNWWDCICKEYDLDLKRIMSIKKDGRVILKSKQMLTIPINSNFVNLATHEQNSQIRIKQRTHNNVKAS